MKENQDKDKNPTQNEPSVPMEPATIDTESMYPDLRGILAFGSQGPIGAARAVEERRMTGKVAVLGPFSPGQGAKLVHQGVLTGGYMWNPAQAGEVFVEIGKMLADGKTIEAGLALRQLVISGRVKRSLLLVPKSVMRQWQEELYEKFALNVPRYDGGALRDVFDRDVPWSGESVWNACPIVLASSQLAKRRERQAELWGAQPWDLIIVDEAHHARRRDFLDARYRPHRLLCLLYTSPSPRHS
mgnify:CR=1 FL=1